MRSQRREGKFEFSSLLSSAGVRFDSCKENVETFEHFRLDYRAKNNEGTIHRRVARTGHVCFYCRSYI
jgi:hypothetical protein